MKIIIVLFILQSSIFGEISFNLRESFSVVLKENVKILNSNDPLYKKLTEKEVVAFYMAEDCKVSKSWFQKVGKMDDVKRLVLRNVRENDILDSVKFFSNAASIELWEVGEIDKDLDIGNGCKKLFIDGAVGPKTIKSLANLPILEDVVFAISDDVSSKDLEALCKSKYLEIITIIDLDIDSKLAKQILLNPLLKGKIPIKVP